MSSLRIAINCRSILLSQRTGIGRYTYHLLDSLGKIDHANQYILHAPKRLFDFKRHLADFSRYKNFKAKIDYFRSGIGNSDVYHLPSPDAIGPYKGKLVSLRIPVVIYINFLIYLPPRLVLFIMGLIMTCFILYPRKNALKRRAS